MAHDQNCVENVKNFLCFVIVKFWRLTPFSLNYFVSEYYGLPSQSLVKEAFIYSLLNVERVSLCLVGSLLLE